MFLAVYLCGDGMLTPTQDRHHVPAQWLQRQPRSDTPRTRFRELPVIGNREAEMIPERAPARVGCGRGRTEPRRELWDTVRGMQAMNDERIHLIRRRVAVGVADGPTTTGSPRKGQYVRTAAGRSASRDTLWRGGGSPPASRKPVMPPSPSPVDLAALSKAETTGDHTASRDAREQGATRGGDRAPVGRASGRMGTAKEIRIRTRPAANHDDRAGVTL